jgi:propionate CoA-transferase
LADRYEQEFKDGIKDGVGNLTLLFGGGPGDWESRGLNYLAKIPQLEDGTTALPMIKRAIGAHFGQVPMIGDLVLKNQIEAWTLPLGSISRMIRAQATHSPGHITTIGLGTYVDPTPGVGNGGAVNDLARKSPLHEKLVTKLTVGYGEEMKTDYLLYKALPIQVGIIRATTADSSGNLSFEHESLRCDQLSVAMAARNSGGVVIAQVKRLSQVGSLPSRSVLVPGSMVSSTIRHCFTLHYYAQLTYDVQVDCVVVVEDEDHCKYHPMSYTTPHSPVLAGEIRSPIEDSSRLPLNERKVIARRASRVLKPGQTVNLGIGLPEGVASVAGEEGMLPYITLTTEPGKKSVRAFITDEINNQHSPLVAT